MLSASIAIDYLCTVEPDKVIEEQPLTLFRHTSFNGGRLSRAPATFLPRFLRSQKIRRIYIKRIMYSDMTAMSTSKETSSSEDYHSPQCDITMLNHRRSFSEDDPGSCSVACTSDMHIIEVRPNNTPSQSQSQERGDLSSTVRPSTPLMDNNSSALSAQRRIYHHQSRSSASSEGQRRRAQVDMSSTIIGEDYDRHRDDDRGNNNRINRERAHTCPHHQFLHRDFDNQVEDSTVDDEESGGGIHVHGTDAGSTERRTRSLPSPSEHYSSTSPHRSLSTPIAPAPSSRRRAASTSSILLSQPSHSSTTTPSFITSNSLVSSETTTTIKHTLLKLLMLISIYQLLSYTYTTGLSPDVKYKLGEINYDIEEYWYGGRLFSSSLNKSSNRLLASRIVGSSGISFNDDYDAGASEEEEDGGIGFLSTLFNEYYFGSHFQGGEDEVGEDAIEDDKVGLASEVEPTTTESKQVDSSTPPINVGNRKNMTKRRPVMAHVLSLSDARNPSYTTRTASRRMKSGYGKTHHWTISRIIQMILLIPILEIGIRELSRRFRLGSLLRRRMRLLRRGFRRSLGGDENVHVL